MYHQENFVISHGDYLELSVTCINAYPSHLIRTSRGDLGLVHRHDVERMGLANPVLPCGLREANLLSQALTL